MRICLVYDCLYPHTVGGAERWYRNLAERLAAEGHDVTYLTLRQWDKGEDPGVEGVRVVVGGPRMDLYVEGRRRILPPLVFGLGVLWHLLREGRRYDVVHTASFPYFSLLAAGLLRPLGRYRLIVDWVEVWSDDYWREYLGGFGGRIGSLVQRLCARLGDHAFCFSRLHARRLRELGFRGAVSVLDGLYVGTVRAAEPEPADPVVVFAGRHIPEKRVLAIPPAIGAARRHRPELRCEVYGDGPDRPALLAAIEEQGLSDVVSAPGFVSGDAVDHALRTAVCMVLPSRREGYGMVVVEASARGTPSVVVREPDNAATELVDEGENGFVAESAEPDDLAAAILEAADGGDELRARTTAWFRDNVTRLSIDTSLDAVVAAYAVPRARTAAS